MGEYLKPVGARDGGKRDAGFIRHSTASAVGAETATISGAPIAAVFCTISTETRLVSSTMPRLRTCFPAPARRRAC